MPQPQVQTLLFQKVVLALLSGRPAEACLDAQRETHLAVMRELTAALSPRRRGQPDRRLPLFLIEADRRWFDQPLAGSGVRRRDPVMIALLTGRGLKKNFARPRPSAVRPGRAGGRGAGTHPSRLRARAGHQPLDAETPESFFDSVGTALLTMAVVGGDEQFRLPGAGLFVAVGLALLVALGVSLITWPLMDAATRHEHVRFE